MAAALKLVDTEGLPARCRDCALSRAGFCASLTGAELAKLHPYLVRKKLAAGETITHQGDPNNFYYHVLSGVVKLVADLPDGGEQIVGLRFEGDFLGQRFASELTFTAEAASEVELCKVPRAALDALADSNTRIAHLMHRQVATELEETRRWMLAIAQRDARQKVAGLLYTMLRRQTADGADAKTVTSIELPLSRAEIGNYLGLTLETVSRQLTALRRDDVIRIDQKTLVTVANVGTLAAAAGMRA